MKKILIPLMVLMFGVCSSWATEGYDDLAKLVKSKTSDEIIIAFIDVSNGSYALTADEIIQLNEMGASGKVIAAAIRHKIPGRESEAQKSVAASAPPTNVTYTGQPPIVVSPDNADNYVDYESGPPPVDYYYPYSTDITFYPVWQPNYFYHRYHGYNRGYSGGHSGGYGSSGHGGGQGWHGGGSHSSYKQGAGAQRSKR